MKHKENKHVTEKETVEQPLEDVADGGQPVSGDTGENSERAPVSPAAQSEPLRQPDDRLIRLQADFENFRKRVLREKAELYQRANEDLFVELAPVLDHMDMALRSAKEHNAPAGIIDGFKLVSEQLVSVVMKFGLTPFDVEGAVFDPNEQLAISHMPSDTVPENMVLTQTRRGYKLGGKLLRPAEVVVSSGKQQTSPQAECTAEE